MNKSTRTPQPDTRSDAQKAGDEAVAAGNWDGFERTVLLTEDAARELVKQRRLARSTNGDQHSATLSSVHQQPFRWKEGVYRIVRCEYVAGQAVVEVVPPDAEFTTEVKRRIEQDRFHTLTYYQGFGFISFPEDYAKYQG